MVDALGLPAAAISAICYGVASVLQARAARSSTASEHVDPRLLIRLATQIPYVTGILLDLAGFVLSVVALRSLPLYVVQAVIASNLAVTAILVAVLYHVRLSVWEWLAIGAVCAGLAMLGLSSGHEGAEASTLHIRIAILVGTIVVGLIALWAARTSRAVPAAVLGLIAGLGFGAVALSARALTSFDPLSLLTDPATYSLLIGSLIGVLFFATALQRGRVTTVTAMMTVSETVVPAVLGVAFLGDTVRHGSAPLVVIGFLLALAGTLALARFGEVPEKLT